MGLATRQCSDDAPSADTVGALRLLVSHPRDKGQIVTTLQQIGWAPRDFWYRIHVTRGTDAYMAIAETMEPLPKAHLHGKAFGDPGISTLSPACFLRMGTILKPSSDLRSVVLRRTYVLTCVGGFYLMGLRALAEEPFVASLFFSPHAVQMDWCAFRFGNA